VDLKISFFVILRNSSVVGCFFAHYEDMWKRTSLMCKGGLSYRSVVVVLVIDVEECGGWK